jgi:hypothetical protein
MSRFIQIGEEIINLQNVLRVERGKDQGGRTTVIVYFSGGESNESRYTDEQADAVWKQFTELATSWHVPEPDHHAPAGPGRTARQP